MADKYVYSESFKQHVVSEIESGKFSSFNAARKAYDIGGSKTISEWVKKYGKEHLLPRTITVTKADEKSEVKKLRKRVKELERAFMYASLITDRYSRKIVGAYLGDTLESIGCQEALKQALKQLPSGANVIHHSDRGCQYCCHDYIEMLNNCNVKVSMTEKYHCYENAVAERVNGILKDEYNLDACFKTKEQALKSFNQAIMLYNTRRPHLGLNYATPEEVHNGEKEGCIIPPLGLLKKAA